MVDGRTGAARVRRTADSAVPSRARGDDHLVDARVHVNEVVGQAVAIEVRQRHTAAANEGDNPGTM